MRRAAGCLVNLGLTLLSIAATFYLAHLADRAFGLVYEPKFVPGQSGLLFPPGTHDEYDMHDYRIVEDINSLGFRDNEVSIARSDKYRIVTIGDSFTYGWGVNLEDTWGKRLEAILNSRGLNVEVFNLGKPGGSPDDYALIAETAVPVLKPDLVLIGVLAGDDLQQVDLVSPPSVQMRVWYPNITRWLRLRTPDAPPATPWRNDAEATRKRFEIVAQQLLTEMTADQRTRYEGLPADVRDEFVKGRLNPWLINHATGMPDYFMDTTRLEDIGWRTRALGRTLSRLRRAVDGAGARSLVLNVPEGFYVNREAYNNLPRIGFEVTPDMFTTTAPDEAVATACAIAGLPYATVTGEFRKHMDEPGLYLELDRHMSAKGNALYAALIEAQVEAAMTDKVK